MRHTKFILLLVIALLGTDCSDSDRACTGRDTGEGFGPADSKQTLLVVCTLISSGKECAPAPPPTMLPEIVDWIATYVGKGCPRIDYKNRTIRDGWKRDIVPIVTDGKLAGLGSAGANGRWEDGKGDDIVVSLDEVIQNRESKASGAR